MWKIMKKKCFDVICLRDLIHFVKVIFLFKIICQIVLFVEQYFHLHHNICYSFFSKRKEKFYFKLLLFYWLNCVLLKQDKKKICSHVFGCMKISSKKKNDT